MKFEPGTRTGTETRTKTRIVAGAGAGAGAGTRTRTRIGAETETEAETEEETKKENRTTMFELSGERELCEECAPALQLLKDGGALIMRCITFADLKKALEECLSTSSANALLYFVGERCGIRSYQRLKWIYQERTTLLEAAARLKWDELWGDFSFDLDQNGTGTVYIRDSFEARGYGPSKEPVCYFIKGYLTGLLSQAFNRDLRLTETECAARGDRRCTFQSRPNPSGSPR